MKTTYNIIGDIHGRPFWEDLLVDDGINIFVGDYLDPYEDEDISVEEAIENFKAILKCASERDNIILLLGNHDMHYIYKGDESRLSHEYFKDIQKLFMDNINRFLISFSIENKMLVSHAGISDRWLSLTNCDYYLPDPNTLEVYTNKLFDEAVKNNDYQYFTFDRCAEGFDISGNSPSQSPMWIRPQSLIAHNALKGFVQIIGHTRVGIFRTGTLVFADRLDLKETIIISDDMGIHINK